MVKDNSGILWKALGGSYQCAVPLIYMQLFRLQAFCQCLVEKYWTR